MASLILIFIVLVLAIGGRTAIVYGSWFLLDWAGLGVGEPTLLASFALAVVLSLVQAALRPSAKD